MRRNNTVSPLLWAALTLPVLYLAALLASGYEEGMTVFDLMGHFSGLLERPFAIRWTPHTPKFMLGALLIYGFSVVLYCSTRENRRPGEEHGSAKWGSPKLLDRKYRDKAPFQNTILTQNVRMGLNGKVHRRNLLQIVIGGLYSGLTGVISATLVPSTNLTSLLCFTGASSANLINGVIASVLALVSSAVITFMVLRRDQKKTALA